MTAKTGLIVSAHSADFVWRAGGAIALHAERGYHVRVVCLSFGERGESAKLWRERGMTEEVVKRERRKEAEAAAAILGCEVVFLDRGDYPLTVDRELLFTLVDHLRDLQPAFVLSHSLADPYNFDHPLATHLTQEARIIAQAHGHKPGSAVLGAPPVYLFEPHQPEQCQWKPDVFLDIGPVWEKKRRAFECMAAQEHLWEYYTRAALQRGNQAARNTGRKVVYGEAYQRVFPDLAEVLG
ncbi:PIG-L deacetylase family protein [Rhodoligotrophos defluvii]|uniref:PIG-L deacetylase family protein n=1 Tax=Rhodoligotrophos defluvii TaxID=2561934 RepID=UPI0010C9F099|nr:PIG-L deacetylase family protein [Rhodoligotrophos defluvii]